MRWSFSPHAALGLLLALATATAHGDGLDILLTNDDGIDSPGLEVLADALTAAGHRVVVVAPLSQQSGTGAHVSFGEIRVEPRGERSWAVAGTPADAVLVGLQGVMVAPPDLVVAGPNFGQNLGQNVVNSGTVGAAVMAVQENVPAMAVSVGIDLAERHASPVRYPSTVAAFAEAAALTVRLVEALEARRRDVGNLLPPGLVLNVNVPLGYTAGGAVHMARLGRYGGFRLRYPPLPARAGATSVQTAFAFDERGRREAGSDTALFAAGHATLSVLEPPWPVEAALTRAVVTWLGAVLGAPEPARALEVRQKP